jgi:hypothetical protein
MYRWNTKKLLLKLSFSVSLFASMAKPTQVEHPYWPPVQAQTSGILDNNKVPREERAGDMYYKTFLRL